MTHIVDVPGHGTIEFPDNMSSDDIEKVIQSNFSTDNQSVSEDIISGLKKAPEDLYKQISSLPEAVTDIKKMTGSEIGKNLLGSLLSIGPAAFNLPSSIDKKLAEKGIIPKSFAKLIPHIDEVDYDKLFGLKSNAGSSLLKGIAQAPLYAIDPEASVIKKLLNQVAEGGLLGAAQSDNPIKSGAEGAILGTLPTAAKGVSSLAKGTGKVAGIFTGADVSKTMLANALLKKLNKASEKGNANSPEVASRLQKNAYTDVSGEPLPVDIGTLTGNPSLSKLFDYLKKVPTSGASTKSNQLSNLLAEKNVNEIEPNAMISHENTRGHPDMMQSLSEELNKIQKVKQQNEQVINQANEGINSLVPQGKDLLTHVSDEVKSKYQKNRQEVHAAFEPINNSELNLHDIAKKTDFTSYQNVSKELLDHQDELRTLFGSDSEMGPRLNSELNAASKFIGPSHDEHIENMARQELGRLNLPERYLPEIKDSLKNKVPQDKPVKMTLSNVIDRVKNLGKLEAAAKSLGQNNEARLLGKLRNALKSDTHNILKGSGNQDLAQQWEHANKLHQEKIVPYWQDPLIRKTVTEKNYNPDSDKLAKALHRTNNHKILLEQHPSAQKSAAFELLSGGNYSADNQSNLNPEKIAKKFNELKSYQKKAIHQYIPEASNYLENLSPLIEQNKLIEKHSKDLKSKQRELFKQQEHDKKIKNSLIEALLEQGRVQRENGASLDLSSIPKSLSSLMGKTLGIAGLAGGAGAKMLTDILTSKELREAYLSNKKSIKNSKGNK